MGVETKRSNPLITGFVLSATSLHPCVCISHSYVHVQCMWCVHMNPDEWEIAINGFSLGHGLGSVDGCAAAGGSWGRCLKGILG